MKWYKVLETWAIGMVICVLALGVLYVFMAIAFILELDPGKIAVAIIVLTIIPYITGMAIQAERKE